MYEFKEQGFEEDGEFDWVIAKREKIRQRELYEEKEKQKRALALANTSCKQMKQDQVQYYLQK